MEEDDEEEKFFGEDICIDQSESQREGTGNVCRSLLDS